MAEQNQPAPAPIIDIVAAFAQNANITALIRQHKQRREQLQGAGYDIDDLNDTEFDAEAAMSLAITQYNGSKNLPEQKVSVEYIAAERRLMIPTPLGMNIFGIGEGRSRAKAEVVSYYWKAARMTYTRICDIVNSSADLAAVRATFTDDNINAVRGNDRHGAWFTQRYFDTGPENARNPEVASVVFSKLSAALQLNCDIRDIGILNAADMSCSDTAWQNVSEVTHARLRPKLQAYSLQSIAALNLIPCGGYPIAAWIRAYGIASGVLPTLDSQSVIEYEFTLAHPSTLQRRAVATAERNYTEPMSALALNLLAAFGLLHLNRDHTFRATDPALTRASQSYLKTVRTMNVDNLMEDFEVNREALLRTAPHPFGLAQSYWLARAMARLGLLASPLAIRVNTAPPPVQRVFISLAAADEWSGVPIGKYVTDQFHDELTVLRSARAQIVESPPSYSNLHRLYGVNVRAELSMEAQRATAVLMPVVVGFAQAQHVDKEGRKDGIALAQSIENVVKQQKGASTMWAELWANYFDNVQAMGIERLIMDAVQLARKLPDEQT